MSLRRGTRRKTPSLRGKQVACQLHFRRIRGVPCVWRMAGDMRRFSFDEKTSGEFSVGWKCRARTRTAPTMRPTFCVRLPVAVHDPCSCCMLPHGFVPRPSFFSFLRCVPDDTPRSFVPRRFFGVCKLVGPNFMFNQPVTTLFSGKIMSGISARTIYYSTSFRIVNKARLIF